MSSKKKLFKLFVALLIAIGIAAVFVVMAKAIILLIR